MNLTSPLRFFIIIWRFLRRYPVLPAFVLLVLILAAIFGPTIAPYDRDIGQSRNGKVTPFSYTTLLVNEDDENIELSISGNLSEGIAFGEDTAQITILDDDSKKIAILVSAQEITEGSEQNTATVNIVSNGELVNPLELKISIKGSASLNEDYKIDGLLNFIPRGIPGLAESGNILLDAGQDSSTEVMIEVLSDDTEDNNENIILALSGQLPDGYKFSGDGEVSITIIDKDAEVTASTDEETGSAATTDEVLIEIVASSESVLEGQESEVSSQHFFTIRALQPLEFPINLKVDIGGDAELGKDYQITGIDESGIVTLPAGRESQIRLPLQIIGDNNTEIDLESINSPVKDWWTPGYYLFGTDQNGRDMFTRLLYGAQISMQVVAIALISGMLIGTSLGILAGYYGGIIDELITRFVDIWYALPFLLVALVVTLVFGRGLVVLMSVLALVAWAGFVRIIRAQVLLIKHLDYVNSARINGASDLRIMWRHILPGILNTAVVVATLNTSGLILGESVLSFVGAGIQPPTPSWGVMTAEGRNFVILGSPHIALIPGAAIFLVVLSFNFLGDWLRDRLDPRLRQVN